MDTPSPTVPVIIGDYVQAFVLVRRDAWAYAAIAMLANNAVHTKIW